MTTRQELEKMVEVEADEKLAILYATYRDISDHLIFKSGAAFVMDKLMPQLKARMELLAEFDDRIGELQKELTAANERIKELEEAIKLFRHEAFILADGTNLKCGCGKEYCHSLHFSRGDNVYSVSYVDTDKLKKALTPPERGEE